MAVLEFKLIIGASDETGAAFASVMARITELSAKIAAVNVGGFTPPPSFAGPSRATMAATAAAALFAGSIPRGVSIPPLAPLEGPASCGGRFLGDGRGGYRHLYRRQSGHGRLSRSDGATARAHAPGTRRDVCR